MLFFLFFIFVLTSLFVEAVFFASDELLIIYPVPVLTVVIFLFWSLIWSLVTTLFATRLRLSLLPGSRLLYHLLIAVFLMAPQILNALVPGLGVPVVPAIKTSFPLSPLLFYIILSAIFFSILFAAQHERRVPRLTAKAGVFLVLVIVIGLWVENIPSSSKMKVSPEKPVISKSAEAPNIFLFVLDTMRRDVLDPYSDPSFLHPALSEIASDGIVLEDVWAPVPYTSGSHASMMFGLYPPHHRVRYREDDLPADLLSLPRLLRQKGYVTGAVSANPFVSRYFGYDEHFDFVGEPEKELELLPRRLESVLFNNKLMWLMYRWTMRMGVSDWLCQELNIRQAKIDAVSVVKMIERFVEINSEHPIFLLGNFMETHWPYTSTSEKRLEHFQFSGTSWEELREKYTRIVVRARRSTEKKHAQFTDQERKLLKALYVDEVSYLDNQIRRLMDMLGEAGVLDRALVLFVSDHGELFGEEGLYGHSCSLNERLLHVPAVLWWSEGLLDESLRGKRFWPRISLVDIPHTILEMIYGHDPFPLEEEGSVLFTGHSFWHDLSRPEFYHSQSPRPTSSDITPVGISYKRQWTDIADKVKSRDSIPVFSSLWRQVRVLFGNRMAHFSDGAFVEGWRSTENGWIRDTLPPPPEISQQVASYLEISERAPTKTKKKEKPESRMLEEHLKALGYVE